MSSTILNEVYNPAQSEIRKVLKESPDAREIYQQTLHDFFDTIKTTQESVNTIVQPLYQKFLSIMAIIDDPKQLQEAIRLSKELYSEVESKNNELEKILQRTTSTSLRVYGGYELGDKKVVLDSYLASTKARIDNMVTHRFRTPLSIVLTSAYLLPKFLEFNPANFVRAKEKLAAMKLGFSEYEEVNNEIKEFFDISFELDRLNENKMLVSTDNIPDLFLDVIQDDELKLTNTNGELVPLNIHFDIQTEGQISIEPFQIEEAIRQILINSIDFKKPDIELEITVTVTREDNRIKIVIADNGSGISPQEINKVFEPFYTKEMSGMDFSKLPGTGCGLGLTIAKTLVERYGRISLESQSGHGTAIILSFLAR